MLKPADDGEEETKNTEGTVIATGGHTFHKLNFYRIPEEKKRAKPPIGMNALSRNNMKKENDPSEAYEESKGDVPNPDLKENHNGKGGSCPNVNNAMRDQESEISKAPI